MKITELNNLELFRLISEGKEKAFETLFNKYSDLFYGAALKMTRSPHVAEEIVQETFVALWRYRNSLPDVQNPEAYLYRVVRNKITLRFKKLAKERMAIKHLKRIQEKGEPTTEWTVEMNETQRIYQEIVEEMPDKQRQVFYLSRKEGLSRKEIAERLHISPHTVKNHLQKAKEFLKTHLPMS